MAIRSGEGRVTPCLRWIGVAFDFARAEPRSYAGRGSKRPFSVNDIEGHAPTPAQAAALTDPSPTLRASAAATARSSPTRVKGLRSTS